MKPTDAGTDRYSPEASSANTPPTIANGTLASTSTAWRTEPKVENSNRKISSSATGMTTARRAAARCWFSNWPLHSIR